MAIIGTDAAREAVAQIEALASELAERDFETRVMSEGGTPNLHVVNPAMPRAGETIVAAPADDSVWWFWWSWGDRIARLTDVEAAAFKIAYMLLPQAGE